MPNLSLFRMLKATQYVHDVWMQSGYELWRSIRVRVRVRVRVCVCVRVMVRVRVRGRVRIKG